MRYIGVDVHRKFAEVAILEDGVACSGGRVPATPEGIRCLADSLAADDEVAIEATVNTFAVATLLEERVARVVISNPPRPGPSPRPRSRPTRSTHEFWRSFWPPWSWS